jgi:hypothetical protein
MWAISAMAILIIGRRSLTLALVLAIGFPLGISWQWLAGTREMIHAHQSTHEICPSGLPDWWWDWLPR